MSSGGVKLGARISHIVSQTIVATHSRLIHIKHKLALKIFSDISDIISDEVHETIGPLLRQFNDDMDQSGTAKPLTDFMATRNGQAQAIMGMVGGASGLLSSISQVVNNELAPTVYRLLASNPHLIPDAGTISDLVAHGYTSENQGVEAIGENGISGGWAKAMIEDKKAYPAAADAIDLYRRGLIDQDVFHLYNQRNGIPLEVSAKLLATVNQPISVSDAALALLRGNMDRQSALAVAKEWGISDTNFDILVNNTGEPPGTEQLLEARRRGFIDDATLVRGIVESRVRNEWVPVLEKLAYIPMSTADAVNAVVQNHITQEQGNQIANWNGLEYGMFDIMVETAGSPLSRTEMEQLYNRGEVTHDQVIQALRESRLKDKYNELAFNLHTRLMEPGEVSDGVLWGTISRADGVKKVMDQGYSAEDAASLVSAAVNRKLESQRLAVVTAAESMYENNAISSDQLGQICTQMGLDGSEVKLIQQRAELTRSNKLITSAHAAIRSKFIAHHINKNQASSLLDGMGTPHQQRDQMLALWQLDADANVKTLTVAQIIKALKLQLINQDNALSRLIELGYSEGDATLLIEGA